MDDVELSSAGVDGWENSKLPEDLQVKDRNISLDILCEDRKQLGINFSTKKSSLYEQTIIKNKCNSKGTFDTANNNSIRTLNEEKDKRKRRENK